MLYNWGIEKAFAYLRVSGKSQLEGDGFSRQQLAVDTYARGHDIKIVRTFREKAIPGATDLENRPALLELLQALAANGVKLVLIEKLERLARDLMIQESIIADFQKRGFKLVSALEPDLLADDPSRILMRQIFGAIAQYDRAMLVAKLRGARDRIRARGQRVEGVKPYGHFPEEQHTLARIREWHSAGLNYTDITRRLNAEKIPTRHGKPWQVMTVLSILKRDTRRRSLDMPA